MQEEDSAGPDIDSGAALEPYEAPEPSAELESADNDEEADMKQPLAPVPISPVVEQLNRLLIAANTVPQRVQAAEISVTHINNAVQTRATRMQEEDIQLKKVEAEEAKRYQKQKAQFSCSVSY